MPTYDGNEATKGIADYTDANVGDNLKITVARVTDVEDWSVTAVISPSTGFVKRPSVVFAKRTYDGNKASAYSDIFYNRILLEPVLINTGNLVNTQVYSISIWNAYFVSKDISAIQESGVEGLSLEGKAVPFTFLPLQEEIYTLYARPEGPPAIAASYMFDFTDAEDDKTLNIVGQRVVMFPYFFLTGLKESLEFLTNVLKSRNDTEQRIKLRIAPRQEFDVNSYVDNSESGKASHLFYGWNDKVWAVPTFTEQKLLTSPVVAGQLVINIESTDFADFREDGLGVIFKNSREYEVFQIVTLTATSMTTTVPLVDNYSIAETIVMPVQTCYMIKRPEKNSTNLEASISTAFQVIDNLDMDDYDLPNSYKGLDLVVSDSYFSFTKNKTKKISYSKRVDALDFKTNNMEIFSVGKYTEIETSLQVITGSQEALWYFKQWLSKLSGKQGYFWLPSYEPDFEIESTGLIDTTILTRNDGQVSLCTDKTDIIFAMVDGSYECREIVGMSLNASNQVILSFTPTLGALVEDIYSVQFLGLDRLMADKIDLIHQQNNVAISDIGTVEVKPEE